MSISPSRDAQVEAYETYRFAFANLQSDFARFER